MPRKKKNPEILTDDYLDLLEMREKLAAKEARVADNWKAAYAAFGEFLIERYPERAREIVVKEAPPELVNLLASYGWKHLIELKLEASKKSKGQQKTSPE